VLINALIAINFKNLGHPEIIAKIPFARQPGVAAVEFQNPIPVMVSGLKAFC